MEAACWPDQIKDAGMVQYNEWHFKDVPILAPDFDGPTIEDPVNSDWATSQLYNTLKASSSSGDADLMKSFAIRFLIREIPHTL